MKIRSTYVVLVTLVLVTLMAASVASASLANWGMNKSKNLTLSVFATTDRESGDTGFGVALTQYQNEVSDLAFYDLDSFRLYQFSKLTPKHFGPYAVNFGFTAAYADPKEDMPAPGTPNDLMTGLTAILARSETSLGLSFDIRATSLAKDFDPIAWFSDPDVLTLGAGLSYSF